jgi:hypothetical protein
LRLESLEPRDVPSTIHPDYVRLPLAGGASPFGSPGPTGTTPAQIRHAYGFDRIAFGGVPGDGRGTTIAIVDAFDDPNSANDLHQFDVRFGLPDPVFAKVNQNGGTALPPADGGWASEIALDVEWAHAIAPGANILLVESNDDSFSNLNAAVRFAASQPGVVAVSMSWGGGEFSRERNWDSYFTTPSGHSGVTFVTASGDNGAPPSYPAVSPNVLSVGGTTLSLNSSGTILGESAWSGSGGGISAYELLPGYQVGVVTQTSTRRANPDVAYDADPNTGFPVYDSFNNPPSAAWDQYGGTSAATPQWAALIAIADQGRAAIGLGSLDGPTQTLPKIYALPSADFHDITTGSSRGFPSYPAIPGYDLATGRGSPVADRIVADLVGQPAFVPVAAGQPFATGADAGGGPHVKVFNGDGSLRFSFLAYEATFTGGVRVALGDVTGDSVPDIITAPGPGHVPLVEIFDGASGAIVNSFLAYDASFTGGVYLAAADLKGLGYADIVTGADAGGGPHVKAFDGRTLAMFQSFFAYNTTFTGGVRVAAADVNGDGKADIITGAGPGGGPHVKVFDGVTAAPISSFFAFSSTYTGGVYVAGGNLTGTSPAEVIASQGQGTAAHVRVFNGQTGGQLADFLAFDSVPFPNGVRVAVADRDGDGLMDIVVGSGPGSSRVRVFKGTNLTLLNEIIAYDPGFIGGVFVG